MSTTTGSNALPVPQSGDSPDVVRDITALANAVDPLLAAGYVCTSTTRPASPTPAQRIVWETDTLRHSYFDGTNWWPLTNPPRCKAAMSADSTIATSTPTTIALGAEVYDTDSMHDNVTNNSRITVHTSGIYTFTAQATFGNNATGYRYLNIKINGATTFAGPEIGPGSNGAFTMQAVGEAQMNAGDYVELIAGQGSGSTLSLIASGTYLTARWVSPL